MPDIIVPSITVNYSVEEVLKLIEDDLFRNHSYLATEVKPVLDGGYKDCNCDSWGVYRGDECRCAIKPVRLNYFTVAAKENK